MDDVISLGVGEPDFKTPWHIRQTGINSLEQGATRYTANAGLILLRNEIANYYKRRFNVNYSADGEIMVTVGGSEGIDMAIRSLVCPGDEVLVVEPSFVCYKPIIEICGGVAVPIVTENKNNFKLMPEEIENAVTDKTKLIVLPFPNNPTGAVMRRSDLEKIAEVIKSTICSFCQTRFTASLPMEMRNIPLLHLLTVCRRERLLLTAFQNIFYDRLATWLCARSGSCY